VFVSFYISTVMLTFVITSLLVVLIESPLANLTRLFTNPKSKGKKKESNDDDVNPQFSSGESDSESGDEDRRRGVWGLLLRNSLPSTANLELSLRTTHSGNAHSKDRNEASSLLH
jgi:hypothetical protein